MSHAVSQIGQLPELTNNWDSSSKLVYKFFKVRRCVFGVDTILWPRNKHHNLGNWFKLEADNPFTLLDNAFQFLDIEDDMAWYGKPRHERIREARSLSVQMMMDVAHHVGRNLYFHLITSFLLVLEDVLTLDYSDICEKIFEELFRYFVNITGLTALNGDAYSTLKVVYTDENDETIEKKISSKPNLFVYNPDVLSNITSRRIDNKRSLLAVVEVKNLLEKRKRGMDVCSFTGAAKRRKGDQVDPSGEGSSAEGEEGAARHEDERTSGHNEPSPSFQTEHAEVNHCALMQDNYENGTARPLTEQEEEMVKAFLPQLLGAVAATDSSPLLHLHNIPLRGFTGKNFIEKSAIGIGVIGFKVFIINFICVRRAAVDIDAPPLDMHSIPRIAGLGLDILISEPLSILRRNDRNKLFKVLYALQNITSGNNMWPFTT